MANKLEACLNTRLAYPGHVAALIDDFVRQPVFEAPVGCVSLRNEHLKTPRNQTEPFHM